MLDTNMCSFIMRERPPAVLQRLQRATVDQNTIVISVITYYEMLLGTTGRKASPRYGPLVDAFVARLAAVLPWERSAADEAIRIRKDLFARGAPIGPNDTMIAAHARTAGAVLVTNNTREFARVKGLKVEDWSE
jgi:tRNA(fMet)-specific endonuclease VapC